MKRGAKAVGAARSLGAAPASSSSRRSGARSAEPLPPEEVDKADEKPRSSSSSSSHRRRCDGAVGEDEDVVIKDETEDEVPMEVDGSKMVNVLVTEDDVDNVICFVCSSGDDEDNILLCDW